MADARVSQLTQMQLRAAAVRERFKAEGINLAQWAREHDLDYGLVKVVITGNRRCNYGKSHRIAVALGLKDPPPSAKPRFTGVDQIAGART